MPICIECRYPVPQLYTTYSRADDRTLGRGVRLTICPRCKKFADKYVEHDFVVLFIDLVLIKPQVYRHLLFNRLGRDDDGFDPSIIRLAFLLLLFDVYLTWARVEKDSSIISSPDAGSSTTPSILTYAIPLQYLFFLLLCALETLAFHIPIRLLTEHLQHHTPQSQQQPSSSANETSSADKAATKPHPNRISTALLVSSCSKLFPILMVIWDYDLPSSAGAVSWAVMFGNVAALEIALGCGHLRAAALVACGAACRAVVGGAVLTGAGVGVGVGSVGNFGGSSAALLAALGENWKHGGGLTGAAGVLGKEVGSLVGLG